jgi:Ca2+:H+ antiporter
LLRLLSFFFSVSLLRGAVLPAFIITLIVYGSYLFFQLYSHAALYSDESSDTSKSTPYTHRSKKGENKVDDKPTTCHSSAAMASKSLPATNSGTDAHNGDPEMGISAHQEKEEEHEMPMLSISVTIGLLVTVTAVRSQAAALGVSKVDLYMLACRRHS